MKTLLLKGKNGGTRKKTKIHLDKFADFVILNNKSRQRHHGI